MAKASDFQVQTRWTKETEIDLSAQAGSFIVSGLPTNVFMWYFSISGMQNDSASSFPQLEAQVSTDGGSSFITSTNYDTERIISSTETNGNDRWIIAPTTPPDGNTDALIEEIWIQGISFSDTFEVFGWGQNSRGEDVVVWQLTTIPAAKIDAIKFMLETDNFQHGTMEVWSA